MYTYTLLCVLSAICISASPQYTIVFPYQQAAALPRARIGGLHQLQDKLNYFRYSVQGTHLSQKVKVQLYYESLCPDCRLFDVTHFAPTVTKLSEYLDVHVYPYGNARTVDVDGKVQVICQHGPAECYGNMLHACAIDNISNLTTAILYNSCMMETQQNKFGSDDEAADKCGQRMNINSEPIKSCAKSPRGMELLKAYGVESKKADFHSVPHILINGEVNDGDNFFRDVCAAFTNPPDECNQLYHK